MEQTKHGFYCPTKKKEGTFEASFPALEICPACGRAKGKDFGQCNFLVIPSVVDIISKEFRAA